MNSLCARSGAALLVIGLAAFVTSCGKDDSDLHQFIETTKSTNVGSVKPIPQFEPYKSFVYSAGELRDPFVASVDIDEDTQETVNSLRPDQQRPKEPLEIFPLDTLAMVGIMQQDNNLWGLIKDPQNVVHRVQVGNYIGQNEGRITEISESDIHLIEIIPDGIGGYIERDAAIATGNE